MHVGHLTPSFASYPLQVLNSDSVSMRHFCFTVKLYYSVNRSQYIIQYYLQYTGYHKDILKL